MSFLKVERTDVVKFLSYSYYNNVYYTILLMIEILDGEKFKKNSRYNLINQA